MFRYAFLLVALLASTTAAFGSTAALFDQLHHDFGSVPRGASVDHQFQLTNKTGQPMHIAGVRVSCGCTTAWALKRDIAPGESADILARMDTSRFSGVRKVTVFVQFDQPQWEEVSLTVQANSRDDITFSPQALAFGRVKAGRGAEAGMDISVLGNNGWQIQQVKAESSYVKADFHEVRRDTGGITYRVTAKLRPDTPAGTWYTNVWLVTNNPGSPQLQVPLTVEIDSLLAASPAVAELGKVRVGAEVERKVLIRSDTPFRIKEIKGTDGQLSVQDSNPDSKAMHLLTIKLKPDSPGAVARTLRIVTDMKDNNEVSVQANAEVIP